MQDTQRAESTDHAFADLRALVVGLAREGTALTRFLAERGALVTATDVKPAGALAQNVASLADLTVTYALGGHPLMLLDGVDMVFVSPGVPLEIPLLVEARRRDLPLSSETRLFTRLCPALVVGITGSSGKTTTTALVGEMLKAAGHRTWVGGNIGRPLIGHLGQIAPADTVIIELSSFQLEFFAPWTGKWAAVRHTKAPHALYDPRGWSPPIAAILNITPNHLDRHSTMDAYTTAKSHILLHQQHGSFAVLNRDDPITRRLGMESDGNQHILWFSTAREVEQGAFLGGDALMLRFGGDEAAVCRTSELQLLGKHNVANALAACALGRAAGASLEALQQAVTTFSGVEHRLELARELNGVRWYDDSIATTPERTVAALKAFPDGSIVLLAGGRDKHLPWEEMATLTCRKARHLILFGEAAVLIEEAVCTSRPSVSKACRIHRAGTLERAIELAAQLARPGDVVLLSPGGTSFDAYRDFAERGDHFKQLVKALE
jgi:UDP-N-acetylmuramoylalanine--D-glutamate ligase